MHLRGLVEEFRALGVPWATLLPEVLHLRLSEIMRRLVPRVAQRFVGAAREQQLDDGRMAVSPTRMPYTAASVSGSAGAGDALGALGLAEEAAFLDAVARGAVVWGCAKDSN